MPTTKCGFTSILGGATGAELLTAHGPTLRVDIGFDPDYIDPLSQSTSPPKLGINSVGALVDTGASESCIDSGLAAQLNLPIVDRRYIAGAHGAEKVNMHLAHIHVPSLRFTIYGTFAGVHLQAGGMIHQALIGRTFLRNVTMVYEGLTGTVSISMGAVT